NSGAPGEIFRSDVTGDGTLGDVGSWKNVAESAVTGDIRAEDLARCARVGESEGAWRGRSPVSGHSDAGGPRKVHDRSGAEIVGAIQPAGPKEAVRIVKVSCVVDEVLICRLALETRERIRHSEIQTVHSRQRIGEVRLQRNEHSVV